MSSVCLVFQELTCYAVSRTVIHNLVLHGSSVLSLSCAGREIEIASILTLEKLTASVFFTHQLTLQVKHLSIFEPKPGNDSLYSFSSEREMFLVGPYKWGHGQSGFCLEFNTYKA